MTFTDFVLQKRLLTATGIMIACVCAAFGVRQIKFDDNPQNLFQSGSEEWRLVNSVFDQFGSDDGTCFLVVSAEQLFSPQSIADLRRLTIEAKRIPGVNSVLSITTRGLVAFDSALRPLAQAGPLSHEQLQRARARALEHPLLAGQLVSADGSRLLVKVQLATDSLSIAALQPATDALWELADRYSQESSLAVQMTGIPAIRVEVFSNVRSQTTRYTILGALAGLTMAVLLMRRVATIFIVCSVSICGAFWTAGALGLVGEKITILTTVLPMLVLVIGLTDSVHIAFDIRQARARGESPHSATRGAMRHLTMACLLTSVTTAVGFGSLYVTDISLIRRFGVACAAGCGITFLAVITVLPCLASTRIGNGVLPPARRGFAEEWIGSLLGWLVELSLRFRWPITISGFCLCVGMAVLASRLKPENQMSESLPQDARSIVALRTVDEYFGGILPALVVVDWPENINLQSLELRRVLESVHTLCLDNAATNQPFSILNLMQVKNGDLSRMPQDTLDSLVDERTRRAIVLTRTQDRGSAALTKAFADLSARLKELEQQHEGFRVQLTGLGVLATRSTQTMISDLAASLGLATIVIFATMSLAYRSLRIGLICLLPNAFPLLLTAALLTVFDGTLRFSSVIVFSVCLGIAVDDTIHLVARFRRELKLCGNVEQALRNSVRAVGSALMVTTAILVVGLAIPTTSDVYANRLFGQLSCLAIFSALLADLILLPAMLACFVPNPTAAENESSQSAALSD